MTEGQLRKAGVTDAAEIRECLKNAQLAANLQLFEGALNTSKQAREPHEWLNEQFPHLPDRAQFIQRNLLGEVPADLSGFLECCKVRRAALRARLRQQLQPDDGL